MARFDGKPVIKTSVTNGINKPEELIQKIVDGKASVYHANDEEKSAVDDDEKESFGHKVYKHLMNGVSHMLPFVVGGGVLIAFGFLIDTIAGNANAGGTFGFTSPVASVVFWIGKAAFALMLPAQSIADRPGLLPGFVGGVFAASGHTIQSMVDGVNSGNGLAGDSKAVSGFLGALFAGFIAGIVVQLIKKAFSWMPKAMDGIKPVFIYPLLGTLLMSWFNKQTSSFNCSCYYDGNRYGRSFQQGSLCIRYSSNCRRQHLDYGCCYDWRYGSSYRNRSFNNI